MTFGVLTCSNFVFSQSTNNSNEQEQQLVQIEQKWLDAESDPETLQTTPQLILADDFIHVYPTGFLNKKEQIDYLRSHPAAIQKGSRRFVDLKVRIFGTTGIVTGIVAANPGDGSIHETAFTDVFAYRDGRWQAVNAQESPMSGSSYPTAVISVAALPPNLEADVSAGSQAWIDGLKANDLAHAVFSAFEPDAIFCTVAGEC